MHSAGLPAPTAPSAEGIPALAFRPAEISQKLQCKLLAYPLLEQKD